VNFNNNFWTKNTIRIYKCRINGNFNKQLRRGFEEQKRMEKVCRTI